MHADSPERGPNAPGHRLPPKARPVSCCFAPEGRGIVPAGVHSGAWVNPMLRGGTNPPPKLATSVNVWPLPPQLVTRIVAPCAAVRWDGSFRHEGCPIKTPFGG